MLVYLKYVHAQRRGFLYKQNLKISWFDVNVYNRIFRDSLNDIREYATANVR